MAKELIIYRHAKSDWNTGFQKDFDRPLSERGIKSAKAMGELLAKMKEVPQYILSSSAVRTTETINLSIEKGHWQSELEFSDQLYLADSYTVLDKIKAFDDKFDQCMIVNHEPTCSSLTSQLIGGGHVIFKTATMAKISFYESSWKSIQTGELKWLFQSRSFI
ncbi:histidine phosphatase family protein [Francisellaceae bacterium]|nr:histidine phosphatase family protein [Francisellaceae bacterium]